MIRGVIPASKAAEMLEDVAALERTHGDVDEAMASGKNDYDVKRSGIVLKALRQTILLLAMESNRAKERFELFTGHRYMPEYFEWLKGSVERSVGYASKAAKLLKKVQFESVDEEFEITEDALQSAFENEIQPWLQRETERVMGELDKKMLGIMSGKFPEARMEYGITRYAPLSTGPQVFLKSLGKPYRRWRAKIRQAIEGK